MSTSAAAAAVDQAARRHREKHVRWRNLTPGLTRILSSLINESLVPALESRGFRYVGCHLGEPADTVAASDVHLERRDQEHIDSVTFNFEKYKSPRFQVHISRRKADAPHDFVHSGNLVSKSSQYYHFWGKPWWLPSKFWSESAAKLTIESIGNRLDQVVLLIEEGVRGKNISKEVTTSGTRRNASNDA
jgi:hypothetical protein